MEAAIAPTDGPQDSHPRGKTDSQKNSGNVTEYRRNVSTRSIIPVTPKTLASRRKVAKRKTGISKPPQRDTNKRFIP
jgi:hypothetical protein